MTLKDLDTRQYQTIEDLAGRHLNLYRLARVERGKTEKQAAIFAGEPKRLAYGQLLEWGFTPDQAVEAFREMCGIVDGVTA